MAVGVKYETSLAFLMGLALAALVCVVAGIVLAVTRKGATYKMAGALLAFLGLVIVVFVFVYGEVLMRHFG